MSAWRPTQIDALLSRLLPRDLLILEDLERFRLLSTGHVRRLHFTEGHVSVLAGTRGAVRVLTRLEGHGLIAHLDRRIGGAVRGSSALVWQLAATGERLLRARRGEPDRRRFREPSVVFAAHTLAVSECAVGIIERSRSGHYEVLSLDAEPASWRSFTTPAGGVAWVKPDLAVVAADESDETHLWIEVDRATEHLPAVLRQCALYQRYYATGREQAERGVFPAVVWSVPSAARAARIKQAIRGDPRLDARLFIVRVETDVFDLLEPTPPARHHV